MHREHLGEFYYCKISKSLIIGIIIAPNYGPVAKGLGIKLHKDCKH